MVKIFEDLDVWQEARKLALDIAKIVKESDFKKDFNLVDQIIRSSRSIILLSTNYRRHS